MAIINPFTKNKFISVIALIFAANGSILNAQAEQTSSMPLNYVADKAIANNPEVQQAWPNQRRRSARSFSWKLDRSRRCRSQHRTSCVSGFRPATPDF